MKLGHSQKKSGNFRSEDYQRLGKQIVEMYDELKPNRAALYHTNFLKGFIGGLGGVIGATVGIAALLWILSLFGQVPIIGHFVDTVRNTMQSKTR